MEAVGETGSDTGVPGIQCTPGEEIACTCSDGRSGTQTCLPGGFELSGCMCGTPGTGSTTTTTTMTTATDSSSGAMCGDGTVDDGEQCDDGNTDPGDDCRADCTLPTELLWMQSLDGAASGPDSGAQVLVADDDTFYLLGTEVTASGSDVWLRHIDGDGNELWTATYDGPAGANDRGADMVFHSSGDIIVVGSITSDVVQGRDFFAMRVTANDGTIVWLHTSDGTGPEDDNDDSASAVAVDDTGAIYLTGTVRTQSELGDIFVRKLDESGGEIWTVTQTGSAGMSDFGNAVVVDGDGNVYVGGASAETGSGADGWLRKYDPDGGEIWTQTVSVDAFDQSILTLDVHPSGDIVAGGYLEQDVGLVAWLRRYDTDGNELWTDVENVGTGDDSVRAVYVDPAGGILSTGLIGITGESANVRVRRHSDDGTPVWAFTYNNEDANLTEMGSGVTADSNGDIVVIGSETVPGEDRNIWVAKIREVP